jgi:hypothetical protein
MTTLVIHASLEMAQQQGKRSFDQTLAFGVGDAYALSRSQFQQVGPGDRLLMLEKETGRCAGGTVVGLQPNGWTLNGMRRYDVLMENMVMVPYQNVLLKRWGVAVI